MNYKKLLKGIAVGAIGAGIVLAGAGCTTDTVKLTQKELEDKLAAKYDEGKATGLAGAPDVTSNDQEVADKAVKDYEDLLAKKAAEVEVYATAVAPLNCEPYVLDNLWLGNSVQYKLDDSDFTCLKDGVLDFDGEDVDFEESIDFTSDVKVAYSGHPDFESELGALVGLETSRSGAIKYTYALEDSLDLSKVSDDAPLDIVFLGKPLTVTHVDTATNELTVDRDLKSAFLNVGQNFEGIELVSVTENKVVVKYAGELYSVSDGKTRYLRSNDGTPNKRVRAIVAQEGQTAELQVGGIKKVIADNDPYDDQDKDEPMWTYFVDTANNKLGVKLELSLNDKDEVLKVGQSLKLPNNYAVVTFKQVEIPKSSDYKMSFESIDLAGAPVDVLLLEGKLLYGNSAAEVNKLAWLNGAFLAYDTSLRDWKIVDNVAFQINKEPINTDLQFMGVDVDVDLVTKQFTGITYNGQDLSHRDNDVLTEAGFVLKNPEDSLKIGENSTHGILEIKNMPKKAPEFALVVEPIKVEPASV